MSNLSRFRKVAETLNSYRATFGLLGHRVHNSRSYSFIAMTLMGLCSSFFFGVILNVLPTYLHDLDRFGLFHFKAGLSIGLLLAILILAGGCLALCNEYFGRLTRENA